MDTFDEIGTVPRERADAAISIFVVDDSDDDRLLFHEAFESIDPRIACEVARNGRDAVTRLASMKAQGSLPRLVFMDINMPLLDGCSALREVRNDLQLKELAIVMFTSSDLPEDAQAAYAYGANACVRKPDTYSEWVDVIRSLVRFFTFGRAAPR